MNKQATAFIICLYLHFSTGVVSMKTSKRLRLTVAINKSDAKKHKGFKDGRIGDVKLSDDSPDYFSFELVTMSDDSMFKDVAEIVSSITWKSETFRFYEGEKPRLAEGVHKHGNGVAIVYILRLDPPRKKATGWFETWLESNTPRYEIGNYRIEIIAKDLRSFFEIYAKVFPENALPEFTL